MKSNWTFLLLFLVGTWLTITIYNYEYARYLAMGITRTYPGSEPIFLLLPFFIRWLGEEFDYEESEG